MKPRKWPHRARKHELITILRNEIRKRTKIEDAQIKLDLLAVEDVELLAMAFGYRDPEARENAERRAGWAREAREREETKRLAAPPLRLMPPKPEEGAA